ncbi:MAG: 1-phosphofructokinase [Candidatus Coatesbacteria bacterium]|nr:1-phosphofructokinase [Candidatus Coatesbacteria bacterium]
MISTLTLNPALDRTIRVKNLTFDDANRVLSEERFAAGKGIDVSRAVIELGGSTMAFGFVGGYAGMELEDRLRLAGVDTDFVRISSETRTNVVIRDVESNSITALNARGPHATHVEYEQLLKKLREHKFAPGFFVISGSAPPGVPTDVYCEVINIAKRNNLKAVLDADGELLKRGIEAGPFMIKPNSHELRRLLGYEVHGIDEVERAGQKVREMGVENVLVSMGKDGAVLVSADGSYFAKPPLVDAVSPIGAGDSLVAGFILGLDSGLSFCESLRLGVAAGAACALTPGTELCKYEDVYIIRSEVEITKLK